MGHQTRGRDKVLDGSAVAATRCKGAERNRKRGLTEHFSGLWS